MKLLSIIVWVLAGLFLGSLIYAFANASLFDASGKIWELLWGKIMWADLYLGLSLFSLWIFIREKSPLIAALWTLSIVCLGNLMTLIYLGIALTSFLKSGDREKLMGGYFLKGRTI